MNISRYIGCILWPRYHYLASLAVPLATYPRIPLLTRRAFEALRAAHHYSECHTLRCLLQRSTRGNCLSDVTCLTQVVFRSDEYYSGL